MADDSFMVTISMKSIEVTGATSLFRYSYFMALEMFFCGAVSADEGGLSTRHVADDVAVNMERTCPCWWLTQPGRREVLFALCAVTSFLCWNM